MQLKCECGNKKRKKLVVRAFINGPQCSDDEPGVVYIFIECDTCSKSFNINDFASFDDQIIVSDDYTNEPLDFNKLY